MEVNMEPDENGNVDFIANKTKQNYLKLGKVSNEVIDSVHSFICRYNIWDPDDMVIHSVKTRDYVPGKTWNDISVVLVFYNLACRHKKSKTSKPNENIAIENISKSNENLSTLSPNLDQSLSLEI